MRKKTDAIILLRELLEGAIADMRNVPNATFEGSQSYRCEGESRCGHVKASMRVDFVDTGEPRGHVVVPEEPRFNAQVRNMVDSGWRFQWDLRTGRIEVRNPDSGGQQTVCEVVGNSYIDKDVLGLGITKMLNAMGTKGTGLCGMT